MGLNCGASCAKYVLFAFNVIFFLGGAAVLGVGIWVRVDTGSYLDFLTNVDPSNAATDVTNNLLSQNISYIHTMAYILIGIGSFVFLVGFMGCCGACKEWRPLLVGYAICLIIIMMVEVGVGIAVGVYKDQVLGSLTEEMKNWAKSYDFRSTDLDPKYPTRIRPLITPGLTNATRLAATNGWNAMQVYLKCCGAGSDGFLDFRASPYWSSSQQAPVFCCKMENPSLLDLGASNVECARIRNPTNSYQNTGCVDRVTDFINANAPAVIGVAVGIGLVELVGVIFAFCLCCAIGDKYKSYN